MSPAIRRSFRRKLLAWFAAAKRDMPWRRTGDPYAIWLSEIMLQQTRVAAAEPYYRKFLALFPTVEALAASPEQDVLTAWAGLGYYTRARNLHKAAKAVAARGSFPRDYDSIRELSGVGDYTAAAIASIAFGLPHAALDGNVMRVLARVTCEPGDIQAKPTRDRLRALAQDLLDPAAPGNFNQAMMELGATVCLPREPVCERCPIATWCAARQQARQREFPVKLGKKQQVAIEETLLIIEQGESILFWQRPKGLGRMAGFWELPEASQTPHAKLGIKLGVVRHTITFHNYTFRIFRASIRRVPEGFKWMTRSELARVPASTVLRKALDLT